jgi:hypothetical protein
VTYYMIPLRISLHDKLTNRWRFVKISRGVWNVKNDISKNFVTQNCYSLVPYKSLLTSIPPLHGDLLNFDYRGK